ncbi:hypothetical protein, variant 2 [Aphanomyces astaci]|uniref:Uncharacterized protein n=1 Tax=Aphanomyces astaci TaxID=112090 RepID=W4G8F5_APHAT|nr:hypothetical protein H257_10198 [Aphanomyces astaci]XP_009834969.1 hypothetical protein, variant 1 [Aphanomyces astaci]XP_009834970.1 hypothetical protein, variant 2 [Aphanomyces astaci]ETV75334.1 hypothetical protein H257_10198 [Aphanomyces astaci]ETV75335.1 hypothetical protein, variant 1 [Aphanomyces astaci]ETV75336.1 hypothetical protein, variant 2 [Aphanomyces astaci]|eukprot:XP_009834968.1 hypothetical protein H257_10198 [Aphanomyces astaci]
MGSVVESGAPLKNGWMLAPTMSTRSASPGLASRSPSVCTMPTGTRTPAAANLAFASCTTDVNLAAFHPWCNSSLPIKMTCTAFGLALAPAMAASRSSWYLLPNNHTPAAIFKPALAATVMAFWLPMDVWKVRTDSNRCLMVRKWAGMLAESYES